MAQVYNLEPTPTAKVLLTTTQGDILLELFAKQTPLTSRNFLQHCLDGYYDGTIFHRLVPGFIIQGGDPTGTGEGGESIYPGGNFADEFHSRLKFNRRGLLGMANGGGRDDNGSQFFLTLGDTRELEGRNTMFGRVVGDTIYNLVKMGEGDVEGERPVWPTKILSTEVLVNPFEDMVRRERVARGTVEVGESSREAGKGRKGKRKVGKTLLSFGEEEREEEGEAVPVLKKAKFNTKLVTGDLEAPASTKKPSETTKADQPPRPTESKPPNPTPRLDHEQQTRKPPLPTKTKTKPHPHPRSRSRSPSPTPTPSRSPTPQPTTATKTTNAEIAALKASLKRTTLLPPPSPPGKKKSALEQMIPANSIRARKRRGGAGTGTGTGTAADREALDMLNAFKRRLDAAPKEEERGREQPERQEGSPDPAAAPTAAAKEGEDDDDEEAHLCDLHFIANCLSCRAWDDPTPSSHPAGTAHPAASGEGGEDDDDKTWMSHTLSFARDRLGKDLEWKRKNEELAVIDPREKEKGILGANKRGGKRSGGGGGGGGRQWDRRMEAGGPSRVTG